MFDLDLLRALLKMDGGVGLLICLLIDNYSCYLSLILLILNF